MWRFNSADEMATTLVSMRMAFDDTWGMDNLLIIWGSSNNPNGGAYAQLEDCTPTDTGKFCDEIAKFLDQVGEYTETVNMRALVDNYWMEWTPAEFCREFAGIEVWWDSENE
jgi:hypothetical protein